MISWRCYASNAPSPKQDGGDEGKDRVNEEDVRGALSRRLEQMSEESVETGGRSARKAVEEAGFGDELKRRLEEKIAGASFRSNNATAFAEAGLSSAAGKGTRDIAAAQPWTGDESVADASLRMLTDAYKPLRGPPKVPGVRLPTKIDTGRASNPVGRGVRIASARDNVSAYAVTNDPGLSEEERKKLRAQLKARFQPGARAVPATVQGLQSLANERIEDAIARGQFKNLPRGKAVERDPRADNPFLDTTEYFLNKMIQKQEIVPPWIEKQQELVSTSTKFRGRLRADWRRHVARSIAARGGPLIHQLRLAEEYAFAEFIENPPKKKVEKLNTTDEAGQLSQLTLTDELRSFPMPIDDNLESQLEIMEQTFDDHGNVKKPTESVKITLELPSIPAAPPPQRQPTVPPFRDPVWEATEGSYLRRAVDNLNSITRSYNLMAPELAKKPYFSLERELKACYADVAPTVAKVIRDRAMAPKIKGVEVVGHTPGGVLDKFAMDRAKHVYDDRKPQYGFKEFWRDLFGAKA
ncbi:hypothetical protein LTR62_003206 [Meristemomyces frigidus]|uniref:DnaJ homologue subfamily C member 28 conserved domain-containing protein n=1 Tax=Meristemomyces frigidus TaxID=1508187 RepID=A0AAN7YRX6_9PEZI|nr:hypothetical protein LTR62_003206 [Meristemomyces frigidus]